MTDTTISRIQNRRGRRVDLPQPLAPGELGLCEDTQELFIGKDPTETPAGIRVYVNDSQQATAQLYLNDAVAVVRLIGQMTEASIDALATSLESNTEIAEVSITQFYSAGTSSYWLVIGPRPGSGFGIQQAQAVVGDAVFAELDTVYLGAVQLDNVGTTIALSVDGDAVVSEHNYANALATAVNFVAGANSSTSGLITSNLNLKIITEAITTNESASIIGPEAFNDYLSQPITTILNSSAGFAPTGLSYAVSESDAFTIDYSLSSTDFASTGILEIIELDGQASLTDDATVIDNTAGATFNFQATVSGSDVVIEYQHDLVNPVTLKTMTKRWAKF